MLFRSEKVVLVARDGERVVGFAGWELPGAGDAWEGKEWPTDCEKKWLDDYYGKVREVRRRVVGERKCYGKTSCYLYTHEALLSFLTDSSVGCIE